MKHRGGQSLLCGVWDATDQKRPHTVPMRQINAACKALRSKGAGRKPNSALLFSLARWGVARGRLPKKSLSKFFDDGMLFEILKANGEIVDEAAFFLGDLSAHELCKLEMRLWHQWGAVQRVVDALNAITQPLRKANDLRRKQKYAKLKPAKSDLAALLGV